MYKEIATMVGSKEHKVFLQNTFYKSESIPVLHKHNYTEIHVISGGDALFTVDDRTYTVNNGSILLIPHKTYHYRKYAEDGYFDFAFQIDLEATSPKVYSMDLAIISDFLQKIEEANKSGNYTVVSAYISLICSHFENIHKEIPKPANDYGFSVHEFFSQSYSRDVRLCDFAAWLHLSERQAERIVIEHTGRTFREELAYIRIAIAKHLLATTDMSLGEVAAYVGYRSYAGFWKAMKKYGC